MFSYRKKILSFEEITSKCIFKERRLKGRNNNLSNSILVIREMSYAKKNNKISVRCWKYKNIGHIKYMEFNGALSEKTLSQMLVMSSPLW